jgi:alkylated DNA repair protein alkB homolog 1
VPPDGLWNEWETYTSKAANGPTTPEPIVQPKHAEEGTPAQTEVGSGRRQPINNTPASMANFEEMRAVPKPAPAPSNTAPSLPLSAVLPKLRWSNIGHFYHWGTKSYEFDREHIPVPDDIRDICQDAVNSLNWEEVWKDDADRKIGDWGADGPDWKEWHETFCEFTFGYRIPN